MRLDRGAALALAIALGACAPLVAVPIEPPASTTSVATGTGFAYSALRDDGTPVRWNSCEPVVWTTRPSDPAWFVDLVERALRATTPHVGLEFRRVPPVATSIQEGRAMAIDGEWAPVLFTLATRDEATWLGDDDLGLAVPVSVGGQYVTAQLVFGSWHELGVGFEDAATQWGGTVLHEIGHLVGLGHVDDAGQLMTPRAGHGPATWGDGDLQGLAGLTARDECLSPPRARDWPWPTVAAAPTAS